MLFIPNSLSQGLQEECRDFRLLTNTGLYKARIRHMLLLLLSFLMIVYELINILLLSIYHDLVDLLVFLDSNP